MTYERYLQAYRQIIQAYQAEIISRDEAYFHIRKLNEEFEALEIKLSEPPDYKKFMSKWTNV